MNKEIKIPRGLATAVAKMRELRGEHAVKTGKGYETNRAFKAVETYLYLKTLTTSGKIQIRHNESTTAFMERVATECRVSPNTLLTRLSWAQELNLLTYNERSITVSSYTNVCQMYHIKKEITIYHEEETSPKLEYILKTKVIEENKNRQRFMFEKKVKANPVLHKELKEFFPQAKTIEELRQALEKVMETLFVKGSKLIEYLKNINPTLAVGNTALLNMFGFKSYLSTTYIKRCLQKKNLIQVTQMKPVTVKDGKRMGECNGYYFFDRKAKSLTWFRLTEINLVQCA